MRGAKYWALLLSLLCIATPAAAQVVGVGTIEVIVTDAEGLAVPGVVVTATATDVTTQRTGVSDDQGRVLLVGLEPSARYSVTTELQGFTPTRNDNVLVRSGQTATVRVALTVGGLAETVQVVSESPVVDTKSATTGADITLQLTESLPTGRSYQSYLQFVPSVFPTNDPMGGGNPAARGGVNYSDILGELGSSSDNFYYFNGINVTDPVAGTFGSNLNTEIIQEQKVLTGGIPAEYAGTAGLLSNVITKSGTNRFSGTANYYFQNQKLVAENKNAPSDEFSTYDTAVTFGGPIYSNRAWFFGSYRQLHREDDVTAQDTQAFLRTVERTDKQGYAKLTWAPTANDTLGFTFLNDPTEFTGQTSRTTLNTRDYARDQGGSNYQGTYSRLFGNLLIDAAYNVHESELSNFSAINAQYNQVSYRGGDVRTLADEQLGGYGQNLVNERNTRGFRGAAQYAWGRHLIKGGVEWSLNENYRNNLLVGNATYTSLANHLAGTTAAQIAAGGFSTRTFISTNASDFGGLINRINGLPNRNEYYNLYDVNGDGTITSAELGSRLIFATTSGNPNDRVNYTRTLQSQDGPQLTQSKGLTFFAQDQVSFGNLTLNLGVRTERWAHYATTGEEIYTFDWAFAPRLSASYDLLGDGSQKVFAYYGRYYDPIRNNMTNFAGTLTGAVREEQVFINNEWLTYRIRGGPVQQDAFFAPTTKTPYTDDIMVGYEVDLGRNLSFATNYTNRRTRDILEDYDLSLYAFATDGSQAYGDISAPGSLWLGLDYFGYEQNPGSNFVIATLAGGKRDYQGLEMTLRKRYSDRWQGLVTYTYSKAEGNTNSDSNADFQGDVLFLDPRAPFQFGRQPGSIPHLFKAAGSYTFPFNLEIGAGYRWNSGTIASRTFRASSRNLPVQDPEGYIYGGAFDHWLRPDAVGSLQNPSWGQLDMRVSYRQVDTRFKPEFFLDIFNVTDSQGSTRDQDLEAGNGGISFGQPLTWVGPRRLYLGVRLGF
jgi:hypothetical protein